MPKRVPLQDIRVYREGKGVISAPIGEAFDFTPEELADIERLSPDAIRMPKNEDGEKAASSENKGGSKKGGNKKPQAEVKPDADADADADNGGDPEL